MQYDYEYKIKAIEKYRQGEWPETPEGVKPISFHKMIKKWTHVADQCGQDALRHKEQNKKWTVEERYELVTRVLAGETVNAVAVSVGIEEMICNQSYRETAKSITENTGLDISCQAVWNIVQNMGARQIEKSDNAVPNGNIESKILYEEADGDWLNLQGRDRNKYGKSKEMILYNKT